MYAHTLSHSFVIAHHGLAPRFCAYREIFTGKLPWSDCTLEQMTQKVAVKNERPAVPKEMPSDHAHIMQQCWVLSLFLSVPLTHIGQIHLTSDSINHVLPDIHFLASSLCSSLRCSGIRASKSTRLWDVDYCVEEDEGRESC